MKLHLQVDEQHMTGVEERRESVGLMWWQAGVIRQDAVIPSHSNVRLPLRFARTCFPQLPCEVPVEVKMTNGDESQRPADVPSTAVVKLFGPCFEHKRFEVLMYLSFSSGLRSYEGFKGQKKVTVGRSQHWTMTVPSRFASAAFDIPPGTTSFKLQLTVFKDGQAVTVAPGTGGGGAADGGAPRAGGAVTATLSWNARAWNFTLSSTLRKHVLGCTLQQHRAAAPNILQQHNTDLTLLTFEAAVGAAAVDPITSSTSGCPLSGCEMAQGCPPPQLVPAAHPPADPMDWAVQPGGGEGPQAPGAGELTAAPTGRHAAGTEGLSMSKQMVGSSTGQVQCGILGASDGQLYRLEVVMDELKQLPADADQAQWFMAEYEMISTWVDRGRMDMVLQRVNRLLG
eukprot:gene8050-8245_t